MIYKESPWAFPCFLIWMESKGVPVSQTLPFQMLMENSLGSGGFFQQMHCAECLVIFSNTRFEQMSSSVLFCNSWQYCTGSWPVYISCSCAVLAEWSGQQLVWCHVELATGSLATQFSLPIPEKLWILIYI